MERPLDPDEAAIGLFWAPLDLAPACCAPLLGCLSEEEAARAAGYRRRADGRAFAVGRGWLRLLLGGLTGRRPEEIRLARNQAGKPVLEDHGWQFSASRSGGVALFAVSRHTSVGVDVEASRSGIDVKALASRFFTPAERAGIEALEEPARTTAALRCWVRKEAYLKALGVGLRDEPSRIELWSSGDGPVEVGGWAVRAVDLDATYPAAVAAVAPSAWMAPVPVRLEMVPGSENPPQ